MQLYSLQLQLCSDQSQGFQFTSPQLTESVIARTFCQHFPENLPNVVCAAMVLLRVDDSCSTQNHALTKGGVEGRFHKICC